MGGDRWLRGACRLLAMGSLGAAVLMVGPVTAAETRSAPKTDARSGAGAIAAQPAPRPGRGARLPLLHEQFLYSVIRNETPEATVKLPAGSRPGGNLLPTGSEVTAPADGFAQIRLQNGSTVRLSPGSRLKIEAAGLTLLAGSCLARHVGGVFPLKIQGAAPLLISRGGVAEIERGGDALKARVHVGHLRTPGLKGKVEAGQAVSATGRTARRVEDGPAPRDWRSPAPVPADGETVDVEIFAPGDETMPATGEPGDIMVDEGVPARGGPDAAGEATGGFLGGDGDGAGAQGTMDDALGL